MRAHALLRPLRAQSLFVPLRDFRPGPSGRDRGLRRAPGLRGVQLKDFYNQEAINCMEHNYQREISVEELADVCKLNRSYFSKLFKDSIGCPPQE